MVLVGAAVAGNSPFRSWPNPPPTSDNPFADCLGIVNDGREFSLWVSEHIISNVVRVLVSPQGYDWHPNMAEEYAAILVEIANGSGGGVARPSTAINECVDHEDNRILELAVEVVADMIVSEDGHLLDMSPWRGTPIITTKDFVTRTDAMRRSVRRRRPL